MSSISILGTFNPELFKGIESDHPPPQSADGGGANTSGAYSVKNVEYIYLYHSTNDIAVYKSILQNGLKNPIMLGQIVPKDPEMALKSEDIFFHPLRKNEIIDNTIDIHNKYFVAIIVDTKSCLKVNNRLYSFGAPQDTLGVDRPSRIKTQTLDEYYNSESYSEDGLPEVRINIPYIESNYFVQYGEKYGEKTNYTTNKDAIPFVPNQVNCRFAAALPPD